jgi:hypothetical protein
MTTQMFLIQSGGVSNATTFSLGTNAAKLDGTASGWAFRDLATTRGSGMVAATVTSVTGPTSGLEFAATPIHWISPPINADVTISGTITFNLWMGEAATAANAGAQCVVERIDSQGAIVSTIANSEKGVELPKTTSIAAQNWTVAATSTNMLKGDRIRIRPACNDAGGTMASGNVITFDYGGTTAAADGDSYVTFTETFGFLTTDPTTTTVYPTTTVSDISLGGADVDKEMWTSRGSGSTNAISSTVNGWTAPRIVTSPGIAELNWFSKPLSAFTLAAPVLVNVHILVSNTSANAAIRAELAVCATDGTSPTIWGGTSYPNTPLTVDTIETLWIAGDDVAVSDGQRLRLRFYLDDKSAAAMATGFTATLSYAGTTGGAAGDTYCIFGQALTEYVASATGLPILVMAPMSPA